MSEAASEPPQPKHDPLAALRQRDFLFFTVSRVFSTMGTRMLQLVIGWHVYELTAPS